MNSKTRLRTARAWSVHLFTATGLIFAFAALLSITASSPQWVFIFLTLTTLVDGIDGMMVRRWDVKQLTPSFDGRKLDDITDFITYVFIPVFFAYWFEMVPPAWTPVLGVILLASAYGFSNLAAKTEDEYFTGFPSVWNVVIGYMFVIQTSPVINAIVLLVLAVLVFVPTRYSHTVKTPIKGRLDWVLAVIWTLIVFAILLDFDDPARELVALSLIFPAYYLIGSAYRHLQYERRIRQDEMVELVEEP